MMVKRSMGFSCHQMNKKAGEQMDTMAKINQFRDERNWRPHHNEKDLALSICLEAAELLELFQWKTAEEGIKQEERIKEELADVLKGLRKTEIKSSFLLQKILRRNNQ